MDEITYTHPDYDEHEERWEFYLRSYMGGQDYKNGDYLTRYINEDKDEYSRRISLTPIDNHCRNIVHIYSSYLWRIPPTRSFNSLNGNVALEPFLKDCDLDGRSFNAFMKEANIWASVYGHVWIMLDKPKSNAGTKAEELAQGVRPYATLFTPENIFDWRYERTESGRFKLTYLKVRESVENIDKTSKRAFFRIWTEEEVQIYEVTDEMERLVETLPNPIGRIPAVFLPANRSVVRGIGISDLTDIAYMQQAIYQELSEIEQLIRISNHPTLVKTYSTDASAGAGSVINVPDELDANLKPYQIQPNGGNLDSVRAAIMDKVESINRMAHMGAVRGTEAQTKSGIALQTEFQLLNARLSEKADILQLCEEQLWEMFCVWQGVTPDVEVYYPDSFDLRDYPNELAFLQQARASGVRSNTFLKAVDKLIADLVLDDDELLQAHEEIDSTNQVLGQF
jgi:hypothetical protein